MQKGDHSTKKQIVTFTMKYMENDFYPAWLPHRYRNVIDLSELAEPTEEIVREANALMETLHVNIAIYKGGNHTPKSMLNGLCTVFKSAILQDEQLACLYIAERRLTNFLIVAYANPLQHHTKIDLSDLFQRSVL